MVSSICLRVVSRVRRTGLRPIPLTVILIVSGLLSLQVAGSDQSSPWMISGKIAAGLAARGQAAKSSSEEQWLAEVTEQSWQYIVLHHSATNSGSVEQIHQEHSRRRDASGRPWLGIGYHFVIGNGHGMADGQIAPTFRWTSQLHGAHCGNALLNSRGIGICLIGNFELVPPSAAQLQAVTRLVQTLAIRHGIARERIVGHQAIRQTACPGKHFPLHQLREAIPEMEESGV